MHQFGEVFIHALPKHLDRLRLPGRVISGNLRRDPSPARIEQRAVIQAVMYEVLRHPVTQEAEAYAESAFRAFLGKTRTDAGVLRFFNGWYETHRTTSLVSAKVIMRLSAEAVFMPAASLPSYHNAMAHMHEVTRDDFGLGHAGHDGMYEYMTSAFGASAWVESCYQIPECKEFSAFLYRTGVAGHESPMNSIEHQRSIVDAMMVSVASELWNAREYNYLSQYIEPKLLSFNPALGTNVSRLRNARGYVLGHAGEVESKHGLHALAAAQAYGRAVGMQLDLHRLGQIMLDYNKRLGRAFSALHAGLNFAS